MPMIERGEELKRLRAGFAAAEREQCGRVVLLEGPSGTGKTTLVNAVGEHAERRGATVLTASASRVEQSMPWGVLTQLLDGATTAGAPVRRLDRMLTEVVSPREDDAISAASVRQPLCGPLLELAGERPLVVCVDDVHHADTASLRFLLHLTRRIERLAVVIVLTLTTPGEPGGVGAELHGEMTSHPQPEWIRLGSLTALGVELVLREALPAPTASRLAASAYRITGGNPYLASALALDLRTADPTRAEARPGPEFHRALRKCLHSSGRLASAITRAVAILGDTATRLRVARLTGTDVHTVDAISAELTAAGLLEGLRFRYPGAHAAAVADLAREERITLHHRAAELLFETGAAPGEVARHLVAAGSAPRMRASSVLAEAAEQALREGDAEAAASFLYLTEHTEVGDERWALGALSLTTTEWRLNPVAAVRRLPQMATAVASGRVRDHTAARTPPTGSGWAPTCARDDRQRPPAAT